MEIESLLANCIAEGVMTQVEHDQILAEIHRDGKVDARESELLSKFFSALQEGRLRIVKERVPTKPKGGEHPAPAEPARQRLAAEQAQAQAVVAAIDRAIEAGEISQVEHDRIMKLVHADGRIDHAERGQLSRLFTAIQSGTVVLGQAGITPNRNKSSFDSIALAEHKRASVDSDMRRESATLNPQTPAPDPEPALDNRPVAAPTSDQTLDRANDQSTVQPAERTPIEAVVPAHEFATLRSEYSTPDSPSEEFLSSFGRICLPRTSGKIFHLHNDRLLDVRLSGDAWIKTGSMVGYYGQIRFSREGIFEHGLKRLIKKTATGEGSTLTKASGEGNMYLADAGKKISVLDLRGQALVVSGLNILAFEPSVVWDIVFLKQIAAAVVGGLFNVRLQGVGMAAITTHFDPVVLRVTPGQPVFTDYHATVAWSGGLAPSLRTDVSSQTLIGRASGETLQMQFKGDGFVIIQPYEELPNDAA